MGLTQTVASNEEKSSQTEPFALLSSIFSTTSISAFADQ
jgi:hypothetical protein